MPLERPAQLFADGTNCIVSAFTGGAIAGSWRRRESERRHIVGVIDASTSPPKERYAVSNDNVFKLIQPGAFEDQLTEILRHGARTLLAQAVEAARGEWGVC